jgi:hypothetical protein
MKGMRTINTAIFLIVALMFSCEDIFVDDISSQEVTLIAPADSVNTHETNQLFLWEPIEGASKYQVTFFSPDRATAGAVVLDSTVNETSFKLSLDPASYEWCVSATNGVYSTVTSCHKLIISESLESKQIKLLAPADKLETSKSGQVFWWEPVSGATEYTLVVVSPSLLKLDQIVLDTAIAKTSFTKELEVGKYEWCVKASDGKVTTEMFCRTLEVVD